MSIDPPLKAAMLKYLDVSNSGASLEGMEAAIIAYEAAKSEQPEERRTEKGTGAQETRVSRNHMPAGRLIFGEDSPHDVGEHLDALVKDQPVDCSKEFEAWFAKDFENHCKHHGVDKVFLKNSRGHYFDGIADYVRRGFHAAWSMKREISKPTEEMCTRARGFIMGLDLGYRKWGKMQSHLDMGGYPTLYYIKQKAKHEPTGHITKWDVADCIYRLMEDGLWPDLPLTKTTSIEGQ